MTPAAAAKRLPRRAPSGARGLAWEILRRVEQGGAYADALLGHALARSALAARDQALVTRLVYGTLAWQGYLDHIVAAFSQRPPQSIDPPVRCLLRLALLQICVLSRIPDFAAVDSAVELAKRFHGGAAVRFVNAVLRRAAAGWRTVAFPARETDPAGYLSTRLSHPRWLVERWLAAYGFEATEALLRADNEPAPTILRVNRRAIQRDELVARLRVAGCAATPTALSPVGVHVDDGGKPEQLPGYADGLFSVQGEASQLVALLVAPRPGSQVLDACAAPGGKATHLAELMDDRGEVVALDTRARGADRIRRVSRRLGLASVHAVVADAASFAARTGFDCVLVDAPCSGLGTLRQHPEVKWRRTPEAVATLAALQQRLLGHLASLVRPGGVLVYATCTLTTDENDNVLRSFLDARPSFVIDDAHALLPDAVVGPDGILRTFPHRYGLDGFFAVRLKREG